MRISVLAVVSLAVGAVAALSAVAAVTAVTAGAAEPSIDERAGKWQILCFDNAAGRYRDCYVARDALAVLMSSSGYELVIVGHGRELRPESVMHIHVDGNGPMFWRENDLHADDIFSQKPVKRIGPLGVEAKRGFPTRTWRVDPWRSVWGSSPLVGGTKNRPVSLLVYPPTIGRFSVGTLSASVWAFAFAIQGYSKCETGLGRQTALHRSGFSNSPANR